MIQSNENVFSGFSQMLPPSELASYSSLFQRLLDPTFLIDVTTLRIREVNESCAKVFGFSTDQFIGTFLSDWVDEAWIEACEKTLRMARRRYYPFQVELKMKTAQGGIVRVQASACTLSLIDQTQIIQIVAKDITQQHEAEQKAARYFLELKEANEKLAALSITDEMTQLFNFRHFHEQLKLQHDRARRADDPYALIFLDLDHFKQYNDRNGHPAGDALLREVAQVLRSASRVSDLLARYGGEEFVVLCGGVRADQAVVLAERIRSQVEEASFPHAMAQPLGRVSVSIGVASFPEQGETPEEIIQSADDALYLSKAQGRNRVTVGFLKKK